MRRQSEAAAALWIGFVEARLWFIQSGVALALAAALQNGCMVMTPETWQKLKTVFYASLELEPEERVTFLARACDGDRDLRARAERLLAAHDGTGDFLASPALVDVGVIAVEKHTERDGAQTLIGHRIGPYEVIREIGHGGMGTVFLAVRADDQYRKQVAIKLVNRGMDTDTILRRFVMERQILANLEHPNIAGLFEGGSTTDGLPYFVMEYVEGEPIDEYCEAHGFTIRQRLELFRQVCAALQYAHQNLVVHRDIKPSNILVTAEGVPKLLDFGIAKLLSPDWSLTGEATLSMQRLMTPAYASPEQLRGLLITTASDVYSLGVVLYELLSGHLPYRSASRVPEEMVQVILREEPERPSTVASREAAESWHNLDEDQKLRPTDKGRLTGNTNPKSEIRNPKFLRGDLDNIVLKALRKEPERRYVSVHELSEDIRRHLAGLPVIATPDTLGYRAEKFIRRNRAAVAAAAVVVIILVTATVITAWQAHVARTERDKAERSFNETRRIANSLLFEIHDSLAELPGATASRELLVKRALEYLNTLSRDAERNPELMKEISVAYRKLGDIQGAPYGSNLGQSSGAMMSYQRALEMQESLLHANPADIEMQKQMGTTAMQIADSYYSRGNYEGALKYYRRSQSAYEVVSSLEPLSSLWKTRLALLYVRSDSMLTVREKQADNSDLKTAQRFNEEALAIAPEDSSVLLNCAHIYSHIGNNLGNPDYNSEGRIEEALAGC